MLWNRGMLLPGTPVSSTKIDQDAIARLTSILSNNMVNDFHVAYQRDTTASEQVVPFTNSQFGIQDFVSPFAPGGRTDSLSNITVNGASTTGLFGAGPFSAYGAPCRRQPIHDRRPDFLDARQAHVSDGLRSPARANRLRTQPFRRGGSTDVPIVRGLTDRAGGLRHRSCIVAQCRKSWRVQRKLQRAT